MKEIIKDYNRNELFGYFANRTNPFTIITTKIDITNIYNLCKRYKSYYGSIGYFFTKALNKVEEFKFQYVNGEVIKYDVIHPSYTQVLPDGNIGFFTCELKGTYKEFLEEFNRVQDNFYAGKDEKSKGLGEVWLSCIPWFSFSGLIPPFDENLGIPQLIWDKFDIQGDKCFVNLMIMSHHGFVDGSHIAKLVDAINEEIANINVE